MTRELKFRAWDKKDCIMDGPYFLTDILDLNVPGEWFDNNDNFIKGNDLIFLQFTAIKDSNGKEIYEGDILKNDTGCEVMVEWCESRLTYMLFHFLSDALVETLSIFGKDFQIIGNIYENPELVDQQ